jgi:Probable transposase
VRWAKSSTWLWLGTAAPRKERLYPLPAQAAALEGQGHVARALPRLSRHWGQVNIPLVGRIRFRWTRTLPGISRGHRGRLTGACLVKDSLGWHICFRIEEPVVMVSANPAPAVGVDRGVVHTMALSTGEMLDMPSLLSPGEQRRLRRLEHKAARQQLAYQQRTQDPHCVMSRRQRRTHEQIAVLRGRQARRRQDWLHKTTTDLAKRHGVVVIEDLRIQDLTRSARGTIEHPGGQCAGQGRAQPLDPRHGLGQGRAHVRLQMPHAWWGDCTRGTAAPRAAP